MQDAQPKGQIRAGSSGEVGTEVCTHFGRACYLTELRSPRPELSAQVHRVPDSVFIEAVPMQEVKKEQVSGLIGCLAVPRFSNLPRRGT